MKIIKQTEGSSVLFEIKNVDNVLRLSLRDLRDGENENTLPAVHFKNDIFRMEEGLISNKHLYYSHKRGMFLLRKAFDINNEKEVKEAKCYPYSYDREYEAFNGIKSISKFFKDVNKGINFETRRKPIKYTFGIEYETSGGAIPQELTSKYGLMALKDGSISGNEYASIVLSEKDMWVVGNHIALLNRFTSNDKECSIHIHFGGMPLSLNYMFILNTILKRLEPEIKSMYYKYVFDTQVYKKTAKSYCGKLADYPCASEMYVDKSGGSNYFGSVYEPNRLDIEGNRKWQIHTRYKWCNFVNAMFYDKGKTIEFRHFRPVVNRHIIIANIHLYSSILEFAEMIHDFVDDDCKDLSIDDVVSIVNDKMGFEINNISMATIVRTVGRDYLIPTISEFKEVAKSNLEKGDFIGSDIPSQKKIRNVYGE